MIFLTYVNGCDKNIYNNVTQTHTDRLTRVFLFITIRQNSDSE